MPGMEERSMMEKTIKKDIYLTVNKILNLISIYMINQEKQFMS